MILNAAADQNEEKIKQLLVDGDDRFSLVNSHVVGATHRVLWCTLDDRSVNQFFTVDRLLLSKVAVAILQQ